MTENEILNQTIGLRDAIIRLCNEADTGKIAIGAIIMAYCKIAESMGISPIVAQNLIVNAISDIVEDP